MLDRIKERVSSIALELVVTSLVAAMIVVIVVLALAIVI